MLSKKASLTVTSCCALIGAAIAFNLYATQAPNTGATLTATAPQDIQTYPGETLTLAGLAELKNSDSELTFEWVNTEQRGHIISQQQSLIWTAPEVSENTRIALEFNASSTDFAIAASDIIVVNVMPKESKD